MTIPFFTLTRQYSTMKQEVQRVVERVLTRGQFILGNEVDLFEREFASYIGVPYAVGVASGTDALTLSIRALHLNPLDEILMPANAYPTYFGVAMAGHPVRLVDCTAEGNIDPASVVRWVTPRTKVIVVVHLYGNPADLHGIYRVLTELKRTDIVVLEDCAQAHGATIGTTKVGSFGDISIFSFYPSKNLGAYGDGGMVVTKRKRIADSIRRLRMYGEEQRYHSTVVSGVSRLDELHAAILRIKLRHLDASNSRRSIIAKMYTEGLSQCKDIHVFPFQSGSNYHLFVITTERRAALQKFLANHGIGSAIHYPVPIHMITSCLSLGYKRGDFPMAERLSSTVLSLPMFPELTDREVTRIVSCLKRFSV